MVILYCQKTFQKIYSHFHFLIILPLTVFFLELAHLHFDPLHLKTTEVPVLPSLPMNKVPSGQLTSQAILPASFSAQSAVKTESSPSMVAKSLHSPAGGFSPVGLSGLSGLSGLPPVGLPPDGLFGLSDSGQPSSGHASHDPSVLLKEKVSPM